MDETIETGFEDFDSALFADDYQTDSGDDTEEPETTQDEEDHQETEDKPDSGDDSDDDHTSDSEEPGEDGKDGADDGSQKPGDDTPQMFTIKYNKKDEQYNLEQFTTLAQKGRNYDKREQQLQQQITDLQGKLDGQQMVMDTLNMISERTGMQIDDLTNTLAVNFLKSGGLSEVEAKLTLENARLKKQSDTAKAKADSDQQQEQEDSNQERVQRDLAEFQQENPDVELTEELVEKLAPDIRSGMTLAAAYRKMERAEEKARLAEVERKLAAAQQNSKNKRNSPGSQKTSGGGNMDDVSIFEKVLFG